jgi:hypothetical protein
MPQSVQLAKVGHCLSITSRSKCLEIPFGVPKDRARVHICYTILQLLARVARPLTFDFQLCCFCDRHASVEDAEYIGSCQCTLDHELPPDLPSSEQVVLFFLFVGAGLLRLRFGCSKFFHCLLEAGLFDTHHQNHLIPATIFQPNVDLAKLAV